MFASGINWLIESISIISSIPLTPLNLKVRLTPKITPKPKTKIVPNSINSKIYRLNGGPKGTKWAKNKENSYIIIILIIPQIIGRAKAKENLIWEVIVKI